MRTAECRPYEGAGAQCAPLRRGWGGLWNGWTMGDGFFAALRMTGEEAPCGGQAADTHEGHRWPPLQTMIL